MVDDLPNWNLNIIGCWSNAYCLIRKEKYKEKGDVWPEHCSEISSRVSERREKIKQLIFHQRRWMYTLVNSSLPLAQEKITYHIPIFGYFRVFKEYPQKSQIWKSETSPNQRTWLGIPWLGLVSLYQIWDFYGYSLNTLKYQKMGIRYFFLCRTKKGEQYEPSSLIGILSRFDCYLARCKYGKRLFIDPEFMRLRDTSKAKQKELKKKTRRSLLKY